MAYKKLSLFRTAPGRFEDYYAKGNTIQLPSNKRHGKMVRNNYPDSVLTSRGVYYIGLKTGTNPAEYSARTGTPRDNLALFTENPHWLMDWRPNKHLNEWDKDECYGAVDFFEARFGGLTALWVDATEAYDSSYYWRNSTSYAPQQTIWLSERIGQKQDAKGWSYGGDYAGAIDLQTLIFEGNIGSIIPAFASNSPDVMLAKFKEIESGEYDYFRKERWRYHDMLISTYWLNRRTPYEFVFKCLAALEMGQRAMQANAVSRKRKIISYYMPEGYQFSGYTDVYPKSPVTGGTIQALAFPKYDYGTHVALGAMEFQFCDIRQQWSDGIRHGTDLDVIQVSDYELNFQPNGQPYRRATETYEYRPGDVAVSGIYFGNNNGEDDGCRWYGLINQWTGTQNATTCRYRAASGNGNYTDNDGAYLIRRFQETAMFAYKYVGVNGRKAIVGYAPDGEWKNYEFDLGNSTFRPDDKDMPVPGAPFCYLIQ